MGLDHFLTKKTYIRKYPVEDKLEIVIKKNDEIYDKINVNKITYIIENVITWRKFNALHGWFVENNQNDVDDCGTYDVSNQLLSKLLDTLIKVRDDNNLASELLPTVQGFFFGNNEYDESYFEDVNETIGLLQDAIKNCDEDSYFQYSSSW
jgi:hypothetical protein